MNCEACGEAREVYGETPDCETERGCLVPPLLQAGQRVMEMRGVLMRLRDLVDPGTVLRMFEADIDDLELLAIVEDELREKEPDGRSQTAD